jgi:hypothetical protein
VVATAGSFMALLAIASGLDDILTPMIFQATIRFREIVLSIAP